MFRMSPPLLHRWLSRGRIAEGRVAYELRRRLLWVAISQSFALPLWAATQPAPPPLPATPQEYRAQLDHKDWVAAMATAEKAVAAARDEKPVDIFRLSAALSHLGDAQLGAKVPGGAEVSFAEALKLIDGNVNEADPRLIDPLRGLGYALFEEAQYERAIPYMDRVLAVARRNEGLFDTSQQGTLIRLADSYVALGRPTEGERYMTYLRRLGDHAYGQSDMRLVPILCIVGNWYAKWGQMVPARDNYRAALGIVVKKEGTHSLGLVEPLRDAAESYVNEVRLSSYGVRSQSDFGLTGNMVEHRLPANADGTSNDGQAMNPRYLGVDGERALLLAIQVLDAHENRPTQTLIDTLVQTGDWFLFKQQFDKALPFYKRAWGLIGTLRKDDRSPAEDPLGFPLQVYYPTPALATHNLNRPASEVEDRYVQIEFTVKADGTVKDARVSDSTGTSRQASETLEAISDARYRPKFINGEPVETTALYVRQMFKQRVEKETE
jgi:TonB family protein